MLDRIQVQGFKSIREMDLELRPINILIGANGSGKSNLLGVFEMLNAIIRENLQYYVAYSSGADQILYRGTPSSTRLWLNLDFGMNAYQFSLLPDQQNRLFFEDERIFYHDEANYPTPFERSIGRDHSETRLHLESAADFRYRIADHVLSNIKGWKLYHFNNTDPGSGLRATSQLSDDEILHAKGSNLATILYKLQQKYPQHFRIILSVIRQAAPFINSLYLQPSLENENAIRLRWKEKNSEAIFDVSSLSDGTLRFIALVALLMQPEADLPKTIIIDEPELGLHPSAINLLVALIRSASTKTQLIISTQSSMLIDYFEPEDIIVVDRQAGQSTFTRLEEEPLKIWLEGYSLGTLWEKNVFGGKPQYEV